ncbi:MAG: MBL fold metallo-hydrolase [Gammaproteobacteria bacterium]|nr:MBL fold metallo-hydrolase [Gammaproteobacteria bacterium]MDH3447617.1 MBL fold metallo-hydrolase [Gammaproteobacteria bacterium]
MHIEFHGAAGEVTGSCHLIEVGNHRILLDCGMIQGGREAEARNARPFAFDPGAIDAVVLSHAHIDHSGRIPFLVKSGFGGPIYTQKASRDLCRIMLRDSAFLNEKDAEWANRKRERKGMKPVEPLYTVADARAAMRQFRGIDYGVKKKILPGITLRLADAGHILGSAIVELWLEESGVQRKLVFSGDLGARDRPILRDPAYIKSADFVLMESTYGDRLHRSPEDTRNEVIEIVREAEKARGNILIPAFAVGRTQHILYEFAKHYRDWGLGRWQIFLDSPMAIEATEVYTLHNDLYDTESAELWRKNSHRALLPNLHLCRTSNQSMNLNRIRAGAIIIAGSGMCTGGRIMHHLKHNAWRSDCHIVITGYQADGTLGRKLVDGATQISLWGEKITVKAHVHTIGGLSAHADQAGLLDWYRNFERRPPLALVHGEPDSIDALAERICDKFSIRVIRPRPGKRIDLRHPDKSV